MFSSGDDGVQQELRAEYTWQVVPVWYPIYLYAKKYVRIGILFITSSRDRTTTVLRTPGNFVSYLQLVFDTSILKRLFHLTRWVPREDMKNCWSLQLSLPSASGKRLQAKSTVKDSILQRRDHSSFCAAGKEGMEVITGSGKRWYGVRDDRSFRTVPRSQKAIWGDI